ncbi:MAG: TIM barrel protein [Ruminococcaceae bacterium]|nr:TIM barrel protein [Oscillospiraceae bacterium]
MSADERPRFGTAGLPESFHAQGFKRSPQAPEYLQRFGLDAFEYQCGHGVRLPAATAAQLREAAGARGIVLSLHAPYYISMASPDAEKRAASLRYLLQSAEAVKALGGSRVIFHPGGAGKQPRADAMALAAETLAAARAALDAEGYGDICLCPETMGKLSQLGALDEVLWLCRRDSRHIPCLDFGHLNARMQGALRTEQDFGAVLDAVAAALPDARASRFHVHFSRIEYTAKGERRHLTFTDSQFGPPHQPFLQAVVRRGLQPVIICESAGTQAEDAKTMKDCYEKLIKKQRRLERQEGDTPC